MVCVLKLGFNSTFDQQFAASGDGATDVFRGSGPADEREMEWKGPKVKSNMAAISGPSIFIVRAFFRAGSTHTIAHRSMRFFYLSGP